MPENILLTIFERLKVKDLISCSEVCVRWNQLCEDQLLWKKLIIKQFDVEIPETENTRMFESEKSFKHEYIRLQNKYPCIKAQVLHNSVAASPDLWISSDGHQVYGVTEETKLVFWKRETNHENFKRYRIVDLSRLGWNVVEGCYFSPSCDKLLLHGKFLEEKEIAIFANNRSFRGLAKHSVSRCNISDVVGRWCGNQYFL